MRGLALSIGMAGLLAMSPADAWAQRPGPTPAAGAAKKPAAKAKKAKPTKEETERAHALEAQLRSTSKEELSAAFEQLGAGGVVAELALPAATERLSGGLPSDLAVVALRSVGAVGASSSTSAIEPYLRHRDVAVRRAAAKALSKTGGDGAAGALKAGLSDPDAMVRGLSATGLGAIGARQLIGDLFVALDHKVPEAASSIGQLCDAAQCERFASKTGQFGFDVMTSGFDQILFREPTEMPDELKLSIVGKVREIGTAEAHAFLKDVQSRWPATWSKRVKQAIDLAVSSTEGAPGAKPTEGEP